VSAASRSPRSVWAPPRRDYDGRHRAPQRRLPTTSSRARPSLDLRREVCVSSASSAAAVVITSGPWRPRRLRGRGDHAGETASTCWCDLAGRDPRPSSASPPKAAAKARCQLMDVSSPSTCRRRRPPQRDVFLGARAT
jgi:hypothetical protein